jgi:putative metallohydrolase (TIGR04338 family)
MEHVRSETYNKLADVHPDVAQGPPAPILLSGPPLRDEVEAQALVDLIISEHDTIDGPVKVVTDGRRTTRAAAGRWRVGGPLQIRYPRTPWSAFFASTLLLLHELAHCFDPWDKHGPSYCAIYLHLVEKYISAEAAAELRKQFLIEGVRVAKVVVEQYKITGSGPVRVA